jgi:hypothetical protein
LSHPVRDRVAKENPITAENAIIPNHLLVFLIKYSY